MALSKKAIFKLRAVRDAILAEPEFYDQNVYPKEGDSWNTPCCIAGWVAWLENPEWKKYRRALKLYGTFTEDYMALVLGISNNQSYDLFCNWPTCDTPAWTKPGTKEAARDAAKYINLFIRNGGSWTKAEE